MKQSLHDPPFAGGAIRGAVIGLLIELATAAVILAVVWVIGQLLR